MTGPWHCNRDDPAGLVHQAMLFSGALVAERRSRADSEQRRPEHCLPGRISGEGGVNTSLHSLPVPETDLSSHGPGADTSFSTLAPGNGTGLAGQKLAG